MPNDFYWFILTGVIGGLVRALVGIVKYYSENKAQKNFRVYYFGFSLLVSAIVGGFAGVLAKSNWEIAFLAGYAGTDFIEGLYKIKKKQAFKI